VAGFSDQVFETLAAFARGELSAGHWTAVVESVVP
jgi:hypothetical protein